MARTRKGGDPIPALEWTAAALGLILTLAMVGLLVWQGVNGGDAPPAIEVRAIGVTRAGAGYVVEVELRNSSSASAAMVQLEGRLGDEVSGATIDYVPARSTRRAGLFFSGDPRGGLELRALGYAEP